jgi:hypothetical protein
MKAATIRTTAFVCVAAMAMTVGFAGRATQFSKKSKATPKSTTIERPDGTVVPGDEVVHSTDTINRKIMDTSMARVNGKRSPVLMQETRGKEVRVYRTRDITVVDTKTVRRASDEVTVPRMSMDEFQAILERYQKGMDQPIETRKSPIVEAAGSVSLDDINKYSDAADSIDKEGIPIVPAGQEETKP